MECSGNIEAIGKDVSLWKIGDHVCALLHWGGYAEKVAVPATQGKISWFMVALVELAHLQFKWLNIKEQECLLQQGLRRN
ncbi:quinone oxidoreductase PIG3-like [Quillaja saponaria]|uniref:Quinone oxidoreductase PIG3-like n=1 Tax=Quillaja saponaria TaxID=32244 RepID=A0AAD7P924_QUISA|nr:quinone oxidoreductase PIG3-like [Quillaja saponaria]